MPLPARRLTRSIRRGFTLPEILIVIVIVSVLALVAVPRFSRANGRRHMESARLRVAAGIATARQAAIQKGRPVAFVLLSHRVVVRLPGTGTLPDTVLMSPVPLDTLYQVTANMTGTGPDSILFNARGFATNAPDGKTITLTRSGVSQSIVVSKTGMVKQ